MYQTIGNRWESGKGNKDCRIHVTVCDGVLSFWDKDNHIGLQVLVSSELAQMVADERRRMMAKLNGGADDGR